MVFVVFDFTLICKGSRVRFQSSRLPVQVGPSSVLIFLFFLKSTVSLADIQLGDGDRRKITKLGISCVSLITRLLNTKFHVSCLVVCPPKLLLKCLWNFRSSSCLRILDQVGTLNLLSAGLSSSWSRSSQRGVRLFVKFPSIPCPLAWGMPVLSFITLWQANQNPNNRAYLQTIVKRHGWKTPQIYTNSQRWLNLLS
jgi:hypothetical protein